MDFCRSGPKCSTRHLNHGNRQRICISLFWWAVPSGVNDAVACGQNNFELLPVTTT